ncbi:MAG: leucine-rich repeat protein, partial [Clostridia bacterium]|nr:leucine-rich repeat protein [Clostridia bacterium]
VFISFDDVTTVLLDTTISAIYSEGSTSEDRALFRQMDSLTTVAHVAFNKNGGYTGEVKENVVDFSGFTETKNASNIYIGHIGRQSNSITEAILFKTLMLNGVDYSGVIQNVTLYYIASLTKVTVPANANAPLTEIRANAFSNTGLKELYVLRSVAEGFKVDSSAFSGCSKVTMYVLDKTSAINAIAGFKAGNVKNVSVEIYNPLANAVSFEGALVKMTDFETASADKLAIRFQFVWEEKGAAAKANIAANYTFKGIGIIASTAATYDNYETAVQNETGLASASLVAQEMLEASAGENSNVVNVLITNADFTDGRRTFLKGYDAESGYYPFCLSLYGMTGDQITVEYYVSAYTEWEDAAGNTYYTFTGIDYTKDGEAKNSISLYDTTLGLVKRGLINGSDYATEDLADRYFYSVLEKGALTTSSFTAQSAVNGYEGFLNGDGSFTYWNVDYHKYTGGTTSAGWGFAPDAVEQTASSGVQWSILKDGAKYIVLITKNKNQAPEGITYDYTVPTSGRNSDKQYYQPFHYKYGDMSKVSTTAKESLVVYSPAVSQTIYEAITTIVVDDGIVALGADSLSGNGKNVSTPITTIVLPESCVKLDKYAINKNRSLTDIIWTGDPDAKSKEKYNVTSLYDLRGCSTINNASFLCENKVAENVVTQKGISGDAQLTFDNTENLLRFWSASAYDEYDKPQEGVIDFGQSNITTIDKGFFNSGSRITTIIVRSTMKSRHNTFTDKLNSKNQNTEDARSYAAYGMGRNYNFVLVDSNGKNVDFVWNVEGKTDTAFLTSLYNYIKDLHNAVTHYQNGDAVKTYCDNLSVNGVSVKTIFPDLFQQGGN